MTTLLAIDTAAPRLQLALLRGDVVDVLVEDMATGQAERLFPALEELLKRNGTAYPDLDRIAVTTGPGSFTGLRIGLSAARGLGLALNIPVIGVPSLFAYSLIGPTERPFAVLMDARRDEVYRHEFVAAGVPLHEVAELVAAALAFKQTGAALGLRAVLGTAADAAARDFKTENLELGRSPDHRGFIDIAAFARFAATADPAAFPPEATYIRDADAKPQDKFRVARVPA